MMSEWKWQHRNSSIEDLIYTPTGAIVTSVGEFPDGSICWWPHMKVGKLIPAGSARAYAYVCAKNYAMLAIKNESALP